MKTVIVTGAAGNLGNAVVKKFLSGNFHVIGTVNPNNPVSIDVQSENFEPIAVDLMNENSSLQFVESVIKKYTSIDAAILTVGGFAMGKISETTASDVLKQYKLNFETTYNIARPVFAQMLFQNYGRIFMTGSRPGFETKHSKGMIAYGLSKSLVFRLSELMNQESNDHNIYTTVIIPSAIDTPQNRKAMPGADFNKWTKPAAIADIIYTQCTSESFKESIIHV